MLAGLSVGLLLVRTGLCECLDMAIGPSVACGGLFGLKIGLGLGPKFGFKIACLGPRLVPDQNNKNKTIMKQNKIDKKNDKNKQ